jgi:SAM-dependent methyltransferase
VNEQHLKLCSSDEWAGLVGEFIIPWALDGIDLGPDVLEVGPGPGRTTDILREMVPRLTAVEVDPDLAAALADRLGARVEVVHADATDLPFDDGRFTGAVSFTMLHHVPSADLQDRLFAGLARVLRPGGVLAGVDSLDGEEFRALHVDDVCVPLDPAGLPARLEAAGFTGVAVDVNEHGGLRFRGTAP